MQMKKLKYKYYRQGTQLYHSLVLQIHIAICKFLEHFPAELLPDKRLMNLSLSAKMAKTKLQREAWNAKLLRDQGAMTQTRQPAGCVRELAGVCERVGEGGWP